MSDISIETKGVVLDPAQPHRSLDFTLLMARMESKIIRGVDTDACLKVLARQDIWNRLEVTQRLQWARLAQMAGAVDTALEILAQINQTDPDRVEAWTERMDLLAILDRREELARVLALARERIGEERCRPWAGADRVVQKDRDPDIEAAVAPFDRLQHRQQVIRRYLELFSGREDCFARQWADKAEQKQGYVPIRRPMAPEDVEEHLSGRKTYGIYLMRSDATVKTAVIDVDLLKPLRGGKPGPEERQRILRERDYLLSRLREVSHDQGMDPLVEFSGGKGYHLWFLFESPLPAREARTLLSRIAEPLSKDVACFSMEVFPKQEQLTGKGMGNLVKLPLGVHRLTGRQSRFVDCHDRSTDAQLGFLLRVQPIRTASITALQQDQREKKLLIHPRLQRWAEDWPELHSLETLCPPLGHIIAACRQGKELSQREEKILFQTIGFLGRGKSLMHHLLMGHSDYNPHLVDFKLSRLRGTPLGCRRIHSLLGFAGDMCRFDVEDEYAHPLLHLGELRGATLPKAEKVENLQSAIENLKTALAQVQKFLA